MSISAQETIGNNLSDMLQFLVSPEEMQQLNLKEALSNWTIISVISM